METEIGQAHLKKYFHRYRCRCTILFLLLFCLFFIEYLLFGIQHGTNIDFLQSVKSSNISITNSTHVEIIDGSNSSTPQNVLKKGDVKIILRYKMHPRVHYEQAVLNCGKYVCMITPDVKLLKNATAILFNPLYSPFPTYRSKEQFWVMYYREAPSRFPAQRLHNGKFNLIMSYHSKVGDIYAPYLMTYKVDGTAKHIPGVKGPLVDNIPRRQIPCLPKQNGTGTSTVTNILWYSSNCQAKHRAVYVTELSKYAIRVDHFGKCGKPDPCSKGHKEECILQIARKYKFYLSFENTICQEYITGKYYSEYILTGL